jgi:hypothetical protein
MTYTIDLIKKTFIWSSIMNIQQMKTDIIYENLAW